MRVHVDHLHTAAVDHHLTAARLRLGGGRVLRIQPKSGLWAPGSYIVDVPSGGMFDTSRVYYAFGVK